MNLNEGIVQNIENIVRPEYQKLDCWAHGWAHISNVKYYAGLIARAEELEPYVFQIAALCHDLGRIAEEKSGNVDRNFGSPKHSKLSIEPTKYVLQQCGINSSIFRDVVEAVALHSQKDYSGENLVAKILRDADKSDSIGPIVVLRSIKFYIGKNFVPEQEILANFDNYDALMPLAYKSLKILKSKCSSEEIKEQIKVLDKLIEWENKSMYHMPSTYKLFKREMNYTRSARDFFDEVNIFIKTI